jgi:hypothetical protein
MTPLFAYLLRVISGVRRFVMVAQEENYMIAPKYSPLNDRGELHYGFLLGEPLVRGITLEIR